MASYVVDPETAPLVTSIHRHPVVPLPMLVDIVDESGLASHLIFTYCHSKYRAVMAQVKVVEDGQPVESLCTIVDHENPGLCRIEYVYDERIYTAEVDLSELRDDATIDISHGASYKEGSVEAAIVGALRELPRFAARGNAVSA